MDINRRNFLLALGAAGLLPGGATANADALLSAQRALIFGNQSDFLSALEVIREYGQPDIIPGLIQGIRFSRAPSFMIDEVLDEIAGEDGGNGWFDWMLWQQRHPEIVPHPTFAEFKREVFLAIDPNFADFLKPEFLGRDSMRIRLEEITWGGVVKDGIPSLDNPVLINADAAEYIREDDLVFGVSINGDARAYPLRIMGWHEMFNDVIGGVPLALAYCTLCGSGILFETQLSGRPEPLVFGSSGFLYRSNKLMFDRETHSLWNQFTGEPVVGPLTESGIRLQQRPVAIDTWSNWRSANPTTKILSLETGYSRDYRSGVVYRDYFASPDLMFPVEVDQSLHQQKDYVFGIRAFGGAKAWPLEVFTERPVINDKMFDRPLVLIGDPKTRTVRAYERENLTFQSGPGGLVSDRGETWAITEDALKAPDGQMLPRIAGHIAYWFAWNGYLGAESELYEG